MPVTIQLPNPSSLIEKALKKIMKKPESLLQETVELQQNQAFLLQALKANPQVWLYISEQFKQEPEFLLQAIRAD